MDIQTVARWLALISGLVLVATFLRWEPRRPARPLFYRGRHRALGFVGATSNWSPKQEAVEVEPELPDPDLLNARQEVTVVVDAMHARLHDAEQAFADAMNALLDRICGDHPVWGEADWDLRGRVANGFAYVDNTREFSTNERRELRMLLALPAGPAHIEEEA